MNARAVIVANFSSNRTQSTRSTGVSRRASIFSRKPVIRAGVTR